MAVRVFYKQMRRFTTHPLVDTLVDFPFPLTRHARSSVRTGLSQAPHARTTLCTCGPWLASAITTRADPADTCAIVANCNHTHTNNT
jgi:hypothetical protein